MATRRKQPLALSKIRIKNFKAIRDSGEIRFTPLTVFIGNNGSGKSSVIEAMEMIQNLAKDGLTSALGKWYGFEHIHNKAVRQNLLQDQETKRYYYENPISFSFSGTRPGGAVGTGWNEYVYAPSPYRASTTIASGPGGNTVFYLEEEVVVGKRGENNIVTERLRNGVMQSRTLTKMPTKVPIADDRSILAYENTIDDWQFLRLAPEIMGLPTQMHAFATRRKLSPDGRNIANVIFDLYENHPDVLADLVEALRVVLPYADDLRPDSASVLTREVYLQLKEAGFTVPGWLLSTGTLRVVALLAVLRHPEPPPLICIEEIENGLDPRTIHFLVEEIRSAVEYGGIQVIITTHSPYLLNLLSLSQIVVVERIDGEPKFLRPADSTKLDEWKNRFAPGELYTMGQLKAEAMQ